MSADCRTAANMTKPIIEVFVHTLADFLSARGILSVSILVYFSSIFFYILYVFDISEQQCYN